MDSAFEWIKKHPVLAGMIALGLGLIVIFALSSGGSAAPAADNGDAAALAAAQAQEAASGNALQQTQAQLQAVDNQTNAGVTENGTNDALEQAIATLQASVTQNANQTTAQAAQVTAEYNAQASETTSTVTAQAAEYASQQTTLQTQYEATVASQKNILDFISGLTGNIGAGSNIISQGYVAPTAGGGIDFGLESSSAGNIPWGGGMFPAVATGGLAPAVALPNPAPIPTQSAPVS